MVTVNGTPVLWAPLAAQLAEIAAKPAIAAAVRAEASAAHASYPQYAGHWDGPEWQLMRCVKRIKTKLGIAFEIGDLTLARPDAPGDGSPGAWVCAYSRRNKIDTLVKAAAFVPA